jgi:hypothetical protein
LSHGCWWPAHCVYYRTPGGRRAMKESRLDSARPYRWMEGEDNAE